MEKPSRMRVTRQAAGQRGTRDGLIYNLPSLYVEPSTWVRVGTMMPDESKQTDGAGNETSIPCSDRSQSCLLPCVVFGGDPFVWMQVFPSYE